MNISMIKPNSQRGIIGFLLVAIVISINLAMPRPAGAACNTPNPNYGTATMQLNVPTAGNYKLWSHVLAPDTTNNSFMVEVDGTNCYIVGDSNLAINSWAWVNHQNGNLDSKISVSLTAGVHTIKLIGREPNVKIDRILAVADQNCTPTGNGDNCMTATDTTRPIVSISSPADGSTLSGSTSIQANASDDTAISKVEFYVQDKLVATDTISPYQYSWDVSSLASGTYSISAKAFDTAGNQSTDARAVKVQNGDTQAPSAPRNLTASAPALNKVQLNWQQSTDNTGVTSYRIVRNNTVIATVSGTTYSDSTVAAGTQYAYYIVALDSSNNISNPSNTANITTLQPPITDTQVPTPPTDVVANVISSSQINIAWKPSTDNVGIKEYDIYRAKGNNPSNKIATTTHTSYGDGDLNSGSNYTYYIVARDGAGNRSQASSKVSATTLQLSVQRGVSNLRGSVQARNGRPIAHAKVTILVNGKRYQATTNWRGRYIMTHIPSGRYEVNYRASGYERTTKEVRLYPGKTKWQDVTLRR